MSQFINIQAEQAILGTCILNNQKLLLVADILEKKHFYFEEHQAIWQHFLDISEEGIANEVTLQGFFATNEAILKSGGVQYLNSLLTCASYIISIRDYAKLMIELWQKRQLEEMLAKSLGDLKEKKFNFISGELENKMNGLRQNSDKRKTCHISETLAEIKNKRDLNIEPKIIKTGFESLDRKLNGGFYSKQLVVVGARTAVGKTTFLQDVILRAAIKGKKCLLISLEIDAERVTLKFLSNLANLELWKIRKNKMTQLEYQSLLKAEISLKEADIFINDSGDLKSSDIERVIKNQLERQPVDIVGVDYIQHIKYENTKNLSATMEISKNVIALKDMARKFDIVLIAAAQINRSGVDKPTLAHFEGSSAIEKNADVAIIIHRAELEEGQREGGYYSNSGIWIVAKNRDGETGEIPFELEGKYGRFIEKNYQL